VIEVVAMDVDVLVVVEVVVGLGVVMGILTGVVEEVNCSEPVTSIGFRLDVFPLVGEDEAEIENMLFVSYKQKK